MKNTTARVLFAVTATLVLASAQAQEVAPKMYAEIGYAQLNVTGTEAPDTIKFSPSSITGVFGYQFTPNMAVEGMLGFGAGKGKVKLNGASLGVDGKVKSAVGVFFKPSVAVSESVDLFGRIGWVHSELELSGPGGSETDRGGSAAYGVGANFNLSRTSYIQAGWMNYYKKDGVKIDGFTVAYGMRF